MAAEELAPLAEHSVWKLIESFGKLLEKAGKKLTHDVVIDRVSISERINQLIDRIEAGGGSFRFDACLDMSLAEPELRSQLVVTLLAVLELARLKVVRVLQSPDGETLFISQVAGARAGGRAARRGDVGGGRRPVPPCGRRGAGEAGDGRSSAVTDGRARDRPSEAAPGAVDCHLARHRLNARRQA